MSADAGAGHSRAPNRILMTADAVGGVWQYSVDLATCLAGEGIEVTVATMGPCPSDEQRRQMPSAVRLVSREYKLEWEREPWAEVDAAGRWLLQLRDECHPDVVHLNGYAHAALAWGCPVLVVAHSCVLSWWRAVHRLEAPAEWDEYRERVAAGLKACQQVVAPSAYMAGEIAALYQIPASKLRTIWNHSSTPPQAERAKEAFCFAAGRVWDEAKNYGALHCIAEQIRWPIYLAGGGEELDAFAPVRMLGRVAYSELLDRMARASIFLHPALYEPFGLATLEAARAGCCLVLADTESSRELWSGAAVFADPRDPEPWVAAIEQLIANPEECRTRGQAARNHSQRYSAEAFRQAYLSVYREMLEGRPLREEAAA